MFYSYERTVEFANIERIAAALREELGSEIEEQPALHDPTQAGQVNRGFRVIALTILRTIVPPEQDVLEVLALVAYQQPISQKDIESHGKDNAGNLLRQLLRRDLVSFERGPGGRKDLQYQTTPRFLSVFGLACLDDLPQAEDLAKK